MMKTITEPARTLPVLAETELLVVGSGPGGLSAAISAARQGVQVILLDRFGCFGGNITQVGVESIAWYRHAGTTDVEGIGIEFERLAQSYGGTQKEPQSDSQALDAESFKFVADEMITKAGVQPLLHCAAVAPILEGGAIQGVITESKSGRQAVLAKRVIDATGDADIAFRAGAPCRKTPVDEMIGATTVFSCSGVHKQRFLQYVQENPVTYKDWGKNWEMETSGKEDDLFSPYLEEPFEQARREGFIPAHLTGISGSWSTLHDTGEATYLNMIHMSGVDGTDVRHLTRAEIEGRYQARMAIKALQRYVPGFEQAKLRSFGMTLGVRDTRKIIGEYNLTGDDVRGQAAFADSIGIFPEFIDGYGLLILPTTGRYFQLPYRSLLPLQVENLLVAGRCVAGDKVSHAATRNMMCCTVTGQGAGVAAAVSIQENTSLRAVNVEHVQQALLRQGVRLT